MRLLICFLTAITALPSLSQEANSLLWEISGNGLEKTSYLYGTMHVSKKIAFRLDDVFYDALESSEVIALESDPGTWLESDSESGNAGYGFGFITKGFYHNAFALKPPARADLASYLATDDRLVNNILYRTDEYAQNFEEETYLDMFIYQAGSKFYKPVIALEDLEESSALVGRASLNAVKQRPDEWLQKKMQHHDLMSLMQEAYRERNISLLDSIDRAMYTEHYLENMLYIRNANMAQRLDSAIRTSKVFAGIGAAHLPGEKGVISLLQEKGYRVKPLVSEATAKGKAMKEKLESTFRTYELKRYAPDDAFFSIALPHKLYPVSEQVSTTYISPDLANGSYLVVHRIPTFAFLKAEGAYSIASIDSLLFENIPGKILSKNSITLNGFSGLDIKNQLKNGDRQRYQIFLTPLEILIFKLGGQGDYVARISDTIFNSLEIGVENKHGRILQSVFEDFEVRMPALHSFGNRSRNGARRIEGYEVNTRDYYFLKKASLNDLDFIEEDTFELRQIQKRFYQDLQLRPKFRPIRGAYLESHAITDSVSGQKLHLKSAFHRGDYYLLGALTRSDDTANRYFSSFRIKEPEYPGAFKTIRDTSLYFTTVSNVNPPKFTENSSRYYKGKEAKDYDSFTKKTVYRNNNDEVIAVTLTKSHDFLSFTHIDSVWALRRKQYTQNNFMTLRENTRALPGGSYEMQLTLTDTASTRGILVKNIISGGLHYELKAVVDTLQRPTKFVSSFFDNFRPKDTLIGRDLFEDKTSEFFKALRDGDSIVQKGYRYVRFENKHADSLMHYIAQFEYSPELQHIQAYLIEELAGLALPGKMEFMKDLYEKSYSNSAVQLRILQAVARRKDLESTKFLLSLLTHDLPLAANPIEIQKIFIPYRDSLPLARKLYPELLEYSTVNEYSAPILGLLAELGAGGYLKSGKYRKYRDRLLHDAQMQLKRHLAMQASQKGKRRLPKGRKTRAKNLLEDYIYLLFPFLEEDGVSLFFNRLITVRDPDIQSSWAALQLANGLTLSEKYVHGMAKDLNTRTLFFRKLGAVDRSGIFPEEFRTQQALAMGLLFENEGYDALTDEVEFMGERLLEYRGNSYMAYYFKTRHTADYDNRFKIRMLVFESSAGLSTQPFYRNEDTRIDDMDSDEEIMDFVSEEFLLKDRKRAAVYKPNSYGRFGY